MTSGKHVDRFARGSLRHLKSHASIPGDLSAMYSRALRLIATVARANKFTPYDPRKARSQVRSGSGGALGTNASVEAPLQIGESAEVR
jgi:hypothetical protein